MVAAPLHMAPAAAPVPCQPGVILVVDDEESVRRVTARVLEHAGFPVQLAAGGRDALELVQSGQPIRLVLLDLTMPDMDGAEAYRAIHDIRPDLPVILLSGFSREEAAVRVTSPGLAGFVQKPYQSSDLLATVRAILGRC